MGIARIVWLITAIVCLLGAIILLIADYSGYAIVTFVLALAAAINVP